MSTQPLTGRELQARRPAWSARLAAQRPGRSTRRPGVNQEAAETRAGAADRGRWRTKRGGAENQAAAGGGGGEGGRGAARVRFAGDAAVSVDVRGHLPGTRALGPRRGRQVQ